MLDFRFKTFINLCKTKSYTQTAKELSMTQPAVTQHIKYLENKYEIKLFDYVGKTLSLTKVGNEFLNYVQKLEAMSFHIQNSIKDSYKSYPSYNFGATRTIGEFFMPIVVEKYLFSNPLATISMVVENTKILLDMLNVGDLEFAMIEGHFNKADYETKLISKEDFVVIVSPNNKLAYNKNVSIDNLFDQRLIMREKGSGSREIFEVWLYENNYSLDNFSHFIEIGNISAIKDLVKDDVGISVMYKRAAKKELDKKELIALEIDGFQLQQEFNFIYLKDSIFGEKYNEFYDFMMSNS